ncbi:hypothetical protein FLJC2902T_15120 [Flavobacterium limnosediminis JC2902]|uniref:Uncharacterized protein n=1 Tax=Flavobacterium limnosediminis JC2902 TaxID=1341181 RepID=V6SR19_9FLAO|nr:hypothetical protein FLJC2902T_15120 [Flavobacterium limnosediminis JC2902]
MSDGLKLKSNVPGWALQIVRKSKKNIQVIFFINSNYLILNSIKTAILKTKPVIYSIYFELTKLRLLKLNLTTNILLFKNT